MAAGEAIKTALERNVKAVTLRPSVGQGTAVTRVRLGADLRCDVEEGPWKLTAGMTEKYGGDGSAPNPACSAGRRWDHAWRSATPCGQRA